MTTLFKYLTVCNRAAKLRKTIRQLKAKRARGRLPPTDAERLAELQQQYDKLKAERMKLYRKCFTASAFGVKHKRTE